MSCDTIGEPAYYQSVQSKSILTKNLSTPDQPSYRVSERAAVLYMKLVTGDDTRWEVTPYVNNSDTVFFIFNSLDGDGWKIISGDTRTSAILAESPKGRIDINTRMSLPWEIIIDDASNLVSGIRMTQNEANQQFRTVSGLWDIVNTLVNPSLNDNCLRDSDYHWIKVLYSTSSNEYNVETINHLIPTTWCQTSPWNDKTPLVNNTHCKVGCVAVAIGQMMYYFNQLYGSPSGLYESVSLQTNNYTYLWQQIVLASFNASSTRWNNMSLNSNDNGNTGYVADLLASIGSKVHMNYGLTISTVPSLTISMLQIFGLNADQGSYPNYTNQAINSIRYGQPVIAQAYLTNDPTKGHAWILDGFIHDLEEYWTTYRYYYVDDPSLLNGTYQGYPIVGIYNDEEMTAICPGYTSGTQVTDTSFVNKKYFLMNWGLGDGDYDSTRQSIDNWHYKTNSVNHNREFFYNTRLYNSN